jgi:hypothetical protein
MSAPDSHIAITTEILSLSRDTVEQQGEAAVIDTLLEFEVGLLEAYTRAQLIELAAAIVVYVDTHL